MRTCDNCREDSPRGEYQLINIYDQVKMEFVFCGICLSLLQQFDFYGLEARNWQKNKVSLLGGTKIESDVTVTLGGKRSPGLKRSEDA